MDNWDRKMAHEAHYAAFDELLAYLVEVHHVQGRSIPSIAEDCDVTPQTIRNWLNYDVMFPHFRTICKVVHGLGLRIDITIRRDIKLRRVA